jgi:predicted Rossmann fold flavoprotein
MSETFDAIVIGAGAAGLMCALTAGQRGAKVLLLEHLDKAGAKILISGGGRCNFTNLYCEPDRFISANPHFHKSALDRYTQHDFIALIERHRIAYHEKTLGQLFCDGSARAVVAMLLAECAAGHVDVRLGHRVTDVARADGFRVETDKGDFIAASLVLATGGLSIPKMGATGFAYDIATRFGLRLTETLPGLVPLTATPEALGVGEVLSGISLDAIASCGAHSFHENILFTHRGLSGPAILQISSYWRQGGSIVLDLLPECDADALLKERKRARPKAEPKTILGESFPPVSRRRSPGLCRRRRWRTSPTARLVLLPRVSSASRSRRPVPKATPRPRSRSAGSIPTSCPQRPWKAAMSLASTPSARQSTSPAGSAAIISNGPGRAAGAPDRPLRDRELPTG